MFSSVRRARFVLASTRVMRTPSMARLGLMRRLTRPMVFMSCVIPFAGRNCACTGMSTPSAAVRAFTVIIPREGGQSIST